jgi:hypothetical protein
VGTVTPAGGLQPAQTGNLQPAGNLGQVGQAGELSGLIQPDLSITNVTPLHQSRYDYPNVSVFLQIAVHNAGADFAGDLLVSGSNDFQPMLAQIYNDLDIPQGETVVVELPTFKWPAYDTLCSVGAELYLDQNNEIEELDDSNNSWSGLIYRKNEPYVQMPSNCLKMGHRHGQHITTCQMPPDVVHLCKGDQISFNSNDRVIVVDAWTTVRNCGGMAGTFTFRFYEEWENDGSNVPYLIGELHNVSLAPGESAPIEARLDLRAGGWQKHGNRVTLKITAEDPHVGSEQPFFYNDIIICDEF